ncbi:hypothetical protein [Saccharophagus degradans]|uniref:Energy transducer TonB n=1 Tax=Saccharophagus degradans (strain 2-40 / ATCC 43961 / DSM 17024) TaxID=203122 RepID=Q21HI8_SACD2|nr:hypothetical protein [Saccharophagus degradans]ABD81841.1 conserved hypothetical protein [Saccharophagus degradans 2-40]
MDASYLWTLLDTAIKLALGASIAISCVYVNKKLRDKSTKRNPIQHRVNLLEDISSSVGHVNHSFAKYSSLVIESTRFGKRWPPARKQELDRINAELVKEFEKLSDAEAKLLMLGEKSMERTLRLYAARIALFRKQVYIGRQDISEQEIADLKSGIMQLREQFYELLSKRYDKLLAA